MKEIILASASPRRKELLSQIGMAFRICVSDAEEIITKQVPSEVVKELASIKARAVFDDGNSEAIVIGADTVVAYDGKILGKPKDEADAYNMIKMLQGNVHQVYTGVSVFWREKEEVFERSFVAMTDVELYDMSEEEILAYVASSEPNDKAGGYGIQGFFARYVKQIKGDYNNVVGLPVGELYQVLSSLNLLS